MVSWAKVLVVFDPRLALAKLNSYISNFRIKAKSALAATGD